MHTLIHLYPSQFIHFAEELVDENTFSHSMNSWMNQHISYKNLQFAWYVSEYNSHILLFQKWINKWWLLKKIHSMNTWMNELMPKYIHPFINNKFTYVFAIHSSMHSFNCSCGEWINWRSHPYIFHEWINKWMSEYGWMNQ